MRHVYCLLALAGLLAPLAVAQAPGDEVTKSPAAMPPRAGSAERLIHNPPSVENDADFLQQIAEENLTLNSFANWAKTHAANPDVRWTAATIVRDQTRMQDDIRSLAKPRHVALTSTMNPVDSRDFEKMQSQTGGEMDQTFASEAYRRYGIEMALCQAEQEKGTDSAVKNWAVKMVPSLQQHVKMVEKIQKELNVPPPQPSK